MTKILYIDIVVRLVLFAVFCFCFSSYSAAQTPLVKLPSDYRLLEVPTRDAPEDCFMTPYDIDIIWIYVDANEQVQRLAVARSIRFYGFARPGSVTVAVKEADYERVQTARRFGQLVLGRAIRQGMVDIKAGFHQALLSLGSAEAKKAAETFKGAIGVK